MQNIGSFLKNLFFPEVSDEVREHIDRSNIKNIIFLASAVAIIDALVLIVYIAVTAPYGATDFTSAMSVATCMVACIVCGLFAWLVKKRNKYNHYVVTLIIAVFSAVFIFWGCAASYRHYGNGEQILAFYTVLFCLLCFVTFRPVPGFLLMAASYAGLYTALWLKDGAASIRPFNYVAFAVISVIGIIVRYYQQKTVADKDIRLTYVSRHDVITGLRNRAAFEEDLEGYLNVDLTVIMSDVDSFKKFNDTEGHLAGDKVLYAVSRYIKQCFPTSKAYRFGGDEFIIMIKNGDAAAIEEACEKYHGLPVPVLDGRFFTRLSFGSASGNAKDRKELMELISAADDRLYAIKREVHKDDDSY